MIADRSPVIDLEIAAILSPIAGYDVEPVYGGFRIKATDTHYVDVVRMLVNWRVTTVPKDIPAVVDRHWCYEGTGFATLLQAVQAVAEWDGSDDTEPARWLKNGQTGELRRSRGT